ncbi:YciI family protein [Pelomonas sp. APW6]|uniref:YciI family protein n=1 Tax=Roseateles subflavus TaxID=3053353 RepID=A0ABT7LEM7_9BURK|nr:YciI family protein [Pelomonas sp. APW6]MDL5031309.1 YciI family protein [Pelomonas sp. APW6]
MRFMILVRANATSEAGGLPEPALMQQMADFHEALARAGVLLDAAGLKPSREGWRIEHGPQGARLLDGPFTETKELIAGYTLIQVRNREEALEWARRFPAPFGPGQAGCIEVRPLYDLEDFDAVEGIDRFKALEAGRQGEGA